MTAQCSADRRRGQRDAGEKQCVNTENCGPYRGYNGSQGHKVRPAESTVSGTKGGFINVSTAKCCKSVALELSVGMKADK